VALVGRPNVGKSTLVNRLVGEKVSIVTRVPGTTRTTVRGVVTRPEAQLVLLDTPGLSRPRSTMAKRMNQLVRDSWSSVDAVAFLVDAESGVGQGDEFLARELATLGTPVVTVVNKVDGLADEHRLLPVLEHVGRMTTGRAFAEVVPVSALTGSNVDRLLDVLIGHLPEAPRLFASDRVSDQPESVLAAEILREKVIADLAHELPHSVAVTVDAVEPDEVRADLVRIDAIIHVERDSQKGIIIGRGGERLKVAATAARLEVEGVLGCIVPHAPPAPRLPCPSHDTREGREGLAARSQAARQAGAVMNDGASLPASPVVRQLDAERFEVLAADGTVVPILLGRVTREALGLRGVAPVTIVAEAAALLVESDRWPPQAGQDVVGALAAAPLAIDELRARLSG
jgi:GTPase